MQTYKSVRSPSSSQITPLSPVPSIPRLSRYLSYDSLHCTRIKSFNFLLPLFLSPSTVPSKPVVRMLYPLRMRPKQFLLPSLLPAEVLYTLRFFLTHLYRLFYPSTLFLLSPYKSTVPLPQTYRYSFTSLQRNRTINIFFCIVSCLLYTSRCV